MAAKVITGEPGESWTNDTGKVHWQFSCNFSNSCGRCIEDAGKISSSYWPTPYHRNCSCTNLPVPPDHAAAPFVDYLAEVAALDPTQQRKVIGASNWALVESGAVKWEDIVSATRIRPFSEVVERHRLSVEQLVEAGVTPRRAEIAMMTVRARAEGLAAILPPAPVGPPGYGPSQAKVQVGRVRDQPDLSVEEMEQMIHRRLGVPLTLRDMASAAGATDDSVVTVIPMENNGINVQVERDGIYTSERYLFRDESGRLYIHNSSFLVEPDHQGKGLGTEVFGRQVEQASRLGFDRIETYAAKSKTMNGYYTWPRFGYDGELPELTRVQIEKRLVPQPPAAAQRLSDLMQTSEGRAWWKAHGAGVDATFDLSKNSLSRAVWDGYLQERAAPSTPTSPKPMAPPSIASGTASEPPLLAPRRSKTAAVAEAPPMPPAAGPARFPAAAPVAPGKPIAERLAAYTAGDAKVNAVAEMESHVASSRTAHLQAQAKLDAAIEAVKTARVNLASTDAERAALDKVRDTARNDAEFAQFQHETAIAKVRGQVRDLLTVDRPYEWTHEIKGKGKALVAAQSAAQEFLEPMIARGTSINETTLGWNTARDRSSYSKATVRLRNGDDAATAVHEWGHAIENQVPWVQKVAHEFRDYRVGNEGYTPMAAKFPELGYDANELGRKDKFDDHFPPHLAYYTGKTYASGDTEIVSMGVEALHRDPTGFAKNDPEFFKFVAGVLDGALRHE